jgi:Ca2+-binding RTX toxin-like protein
MRLLIVAMLAAMFHTAPQTTYCHDVPITIQGNEGTDGPDVMNGLKGDDLMHGYGDQDYMCGGLGSDFMHEMGGSGHMYGGDGKDFLHGGNGSDQLEGDANDDVLYDGNGYDYLIGGDGWDTAIMCPNDGWADNTEIDYSTIEVVAVDSAGCDG